MYLNIDEAINDLIKLGLRLTWDVFKWDCSCFICIYRIWLRLTWDVFKCKQEKRKWRY